MVTEETEYVLGAKVLPWAGAAVVSLAVIYLVSYVYDRGWIGPGTIFSGVLLLCLFLIGVGQWKRDEKEDFGQILTGIGSCGLYLDFAGGNLYQKLYSGDVMIVLFLGLTFANFAYSMWRSSRSFLAIGVLGGFAAALMPLDQHLAQVSEGLYMVALVPAVIIAARRRWMSGFMSLWVVGGLAILPIAFDQSASKWIGVQLFELTALVLVAAIAWASREAEDSSWVSLTPIGTFVTALIGFGFVHGIPGVEHLAVFSLGVAAASWIAPAGDYRKYMLVGAVAPLLTIAPFGFDPQVTLFLLPGLAVLSALASRKLPRDLCLTFAGIELVLTLGHYLVQLGGPGLPLQTEGSFLAIVVALSVLCAFLAKPVGKNAEAGFLVVALLAVGRGTFLGITSQEWLNSNYAFTVACLLPSMIGLAVGFWLDNRNLRIASLGGFAVTTAKAVMDLSQTAPFVRAGLLFALGMVLLGGGYWYIRRGDHVRSTS